MLKFLPELLSTLSPLVISLATYYSTGYLTRTIAWVDNLPAHIKQGLVVVIASVLTLLSSWLSVAIPTDIALWTPDTLDAVVSAAVAMVLKASNTASKAKASAAVAVHAATDAKVIAVHKS